MMRCQNPVFIVYMDMLLLHLKADKELNILFVHHDIFLQITGVLALLEFHIALDDHTCHTCRKWCQQVCSSFHSPAQGQGFS